MPSEATQSHTVLDCNDDEENNDQLVIGERDELRNPAVPNGEVEEDAAAPNGEVEEEAAALNGENHSVGADVTRYGRVVKPPSWRKDYDC